MSAVPAGAPLLHPDALRGRRVLVAGGATHVAALCEDLGADAVWLEADLLDEDAVAAEVAGLGRVDVLVVDAATPFRAAGGGLAGLRRGVDGAWNAVRAVVQGQWLDGEGGAVVLLAPAVEAGEHAGATRAALENTARTTSTEWARLNITPTAVLPGAATTEDETATLVAFLASPAGAYYSGCAFTLGAT